MHRSPFLWPHLDPQGVKPDNSKVAAIQGTQSPEDVKSLGSFLGSVNYLTRYLARLATITAPLRELTKKEVAYVWGPEHDRAFAAVKQEVSTRGVLRYFDPKAETVIQTDASLKGLDAVLLQQGQPVCYASKALTDTEQRYSNIESEALGLVWGLEKFHWLFTIYTGKPVGLPFGSVWANGKQISVLGRFHLGLALTICRNPYLLPNICTMVTANEKVTKQKL